MVTNNKNIHGQFSRTIFFGWGSSTIPGNFRWGKTKIHWRKTKIFDDWGGGDPPLAIPLTTENDENERKVTSNS